MKKKILLLALFIFAVILTMLTLTNAKETDKQNLQSGIINNDFIISAYNIGMIDTSIIRGILKFNFWQRYLSNPYTWSDTDKYYPRGWTWGDTIYNPSPDVTQILIDNNSASLKTMMHRPKIEWLIFGQRSDYQCEIIDTSNKSQDFWFYSFGEHLVNSSYCGNFLDTTQFGNGQMVLHLWPDPQQQPSEMSNYAVKKVMSNREQINVQDMWGGPYPGFGDKQFDWYIKPRIRIDSIDAFLNKKICVLEIRNYRDSLILSDTIKGNYFINQNSYDGRYLESYYNTPSEFLKIKHSKANKIGNAFNVYANSWTHADSCQVDFRIKWLGECEMWIDYLRVEDERANRLLKPGGDADYKLMIDQEAYLVNNYLSPASFYTDELELNHIPCMSYVYKRLDSLTDHKMRLAIYGPGPYTKNSWYTIHMRYLGQSISTNPVNHMKNNFINKVGVTDYVLGSYPIYPYGNYDTKIPNTLPKTSGNVEEGFTPNISVVTPTAYDNWLQQFLDEIDNSGNNWGPFIKILKDAKELSVSANINFLSPIQLHLNKAKDGVSREPTNEEIELMVNLSLCYGSKGIMYFQTDSYGQRERDSIFESNADYSVGLMNRWRDGTFTELRPRYVNTYHQGLNDNNTKWGKIINISNKLVKWGPKLMSFNNSNINTYIYRTQEGRNSLYNNSYFTQFVTQRPGPSGLQSDCNEDFTPVVPTGWLYDCQYATFLQIATFKNTEPNTEYFMVVNRRCSPYINDDNDSNIGGRRKVRAYIKSDYFPSSVSNNWSIYDCEKDSVVAIFPTHNPGYVNLDYFMPGEGKLYKIVPITETGGTLVCDEHFSSSLTVKKNIYNNGYNVTLGTGANLSFEDSAGIYMNGGVLKIGNESQTYGTNLQIKGTSSNKKWQGLILEDCDTVLICGATFSNVLPNQSAVNLTNCFHFKIMNNLFNCASGDNSGGIYADFSETPDGDGDSIYQYIGYNTFSFNGSTNNAVQVVSTASPEIPLFIEGNQFNTGAGSSSSSGIFLSNITGGAIKQNQITNYLTSITLVSSFCDFFGNTISSNTEDAKGIYLVLGDFGGAPSSNGNFVGGYNEITNLNSNSVNIQVENSYFDIDEGYNTFDIDFSNSQRHISGYFPSSANQFYKATYNCFKNNSVQDTASIYVTQGSSGDRITFDTDPYYCGSVEFSGFDVLSLAGGINDTIFYKTGGTGGGQKEGQALALETISEYLLLKDSIELNLRKRNYVLTESQCKRMLMTYPDSVTSLSVVSKLYLSSLSLDSAGNHIQITKTFFETLIQNNPNNVPLIKRANYFVQKCKVALKQYASALQGFQEIINQNPYSYEGLIASWDYAATTLLMGSGGEYNEETELKTNQNLKETMDFDFLQIMLDSLRNKKTVINSYTNENYDQKKFSKQDREIIKTNVENAFTNERTKQIEKLKDLEKKITTLSNSNSKTDKKKNEIILVEAKKELNTLKVLGEVVKTKKPKNIVEHKKIVNADIKKVFNIYKVTGNKETNSQIPTEYNLSQNYPNPFNPVTKINYELPKDGRVKLVIYDILGREIKTLVNELKQAGRYSIEFNGNNYASGVYFYRILVEDGKSYSSVKKMVLIK